MTEKATTPKKSPAPGRGMKKTPKPRSSARVNDAIQLLKTDHARVRSLLGSLSDSTDSEKRSQILRQIEDELRLHKQVEEEIFYPAFRDAIGEAEQHLYFEAVEEHELVDLALGRAKATDARTEQFEARAKILEDLVEHHASEEEAEMFPKARRVLGAEALRNIGRRIDARKAELRAGLLTKVAVAAGSTLGKLTLGKLLKRSHTRQP